MGTWSVLPQEIDEFILEIEKIKEKYHAIVGG